MRFTPVSSMEHLLHTPYSILHTPYSIESSRRAAAMPRSLERAAWNPCDDHRSVGATARESRDCENCTVGCAGGCGKPRPVDQFDLHHKDQGSCTAVQVGEQQVDGTSFWSTRCKTCAKGERLKRSAPVDVHDTQAGRQYVSAMLRTPQAQERGASSGQPPADQPAAGGSSPRCGSAQDAGRAAGPAQATPTTAGVGTCRPC